MASKLCSTSLNSKSVCFPEIPTPLYNHLLNKRGIDEQQQEQSFT